MANTWGQRLLNKVTVSLAAGRNSKRDAPPTAAAATSKSIAGALAEERAEQYLQAQGLSTRSRNYRCRSGEIDLVMADGDSLVFVEVRYRRQDRYGSPAETITRRKQRRVVRAAEHYLQRQRLSNRIACRFDVVSVGGDAKLEWIRDAFGA